jgi:dihydroorotate dehydrogenase
MATAFRQVRWPSSLASLPRRTIRPTFRSRPTASRPHGQTRRAATSSSNFTDSLLIGRLKVATYGTAIGASLYVLYLYITDTRASFHQWLVPPILRLLYPDAEDAHHAGTSLLKTLYTLGLNPREREHNLESPVLPRGDLSVSVFGTRLSNPIGISAGLDKDAEIPDALFALGASVVEVGGVTPLAQPGNPKPRVFRVPSVDGMVNRYGLNSLGADAVAGRLRRRVTAYARQLGLTEQDLLDGISLPGPKTADGRRGKAVDVPPGSLHPGKLLLVQIAKNKDTPERDIDAVAQDYVTCVQKLAPYADVLVVNVSSPNTAGLRDLQAAQPLTQILSAVVDETKRTRRRTKPRVMVKVSPDEDEDFQIQEIAQAVWISGVDGVIVGNTTKKRIGLVPEGVKLTGKEHNALAETGGFSGPALLGQTVSLVKRYRAALDGRQLSGDKDGQSETLGHINGGEIGISASLAQRRNAEQKVIFASGGITTGKDVVEVLQAGASLAMMYTGIVYGGAGTVTRVKGEVREEIARPSR